MGAERGVVVAAGYSVACCGQDGSIDDARYAREGLFDFDTRILSRYRLLVDGEPPELVTAVRPELDRWEAVLRVRRRGGDAAGPILPQDSLEIRVRRRVGPGMLDEITFTDHSAEPFDGTVTIEVDGDFADVAEVADIRQQHGTVTRGWDAGERALVLAYRASHEGRVLERAARVRVLASPSDPVVDDAGLRFPLELAPRDTASLTLAVESRVDGPVWRGPRSDDRRSRQRAAWRARRPRIVGPPRIRVPFDQAADDLVDLRNEELEEQHLPGRRGAAWVLNAGLPAFTGFFGRDSLTSAWQSALLGPRAALGALAVAAATQATEDDAWRDAEPGKMIHEMRRGPLSDLGLSPRDRYYGSQTTPALFVLALSELWHWTGDIAVLRTYRDAALRGLEWAERYGDIDGDGFLEYRTRSPLGLRNQAWKDSDEAIRDVDGRLVPVPIATVEEQAFHAIALERMAAIMVALGEGDRGEGFLRRADDLRRRWHDAYWMPEERYYALALDGKKRQVRSIASNPGHALGAGIVPPEHARDVADRLLSDELFSGWGVRTLSKHHPSYDPFAYHLGAVWPVEQATFALGMKRYGLDDHVERLAGAMLDAAFSCPAGRLPEALSGHDRGTLARPVIYPDANDPQAWSSSAVVQLVQIMLGIYPFAPLGLVALVRPRLPAWLPELTLSDLRVGRARLTIRFRRAPDGSAHHEIVERRGRVVVVPVGPPQADAADLGPAERAKRALLERAPGRLPRAARIALGLRSG
jgi:glycogen debranching enzyme